jgi:putative methionine-R-sulfoxide reductase with GAF domain
MNCKENSATADFVVGKVKSFPGPMDRYSILDQSSTISPAAAMPKAQPASAPQGHGDEAVRFPGEDGGKSLSETAREDLDAALQLLVERAKYITGAMAATISLYEDGELICHACTGTPKQKTGTRLQVESGLAAESVRTRRILRCNDISVDIRTNSENCGKFGISSAMVMPLARGPEVIGVFELLSGMTQAFEERDLSALARLGEMVETAMEHSDTAKQTPPNTFFEEDLPAPEIGVVPLKLDPLAIEEDVATKTRPAAKAAKQEEAPLIERGTIGNCQACGFPVSGHRRLCVECAAAQPQEAAELNREAVTPSFLAHLGESKTAKRSGGSLGYTLGTVVILLATAAIVVWMKFPEVPAWVMQHAHLPR